MDITGSKDCGNSPKNQLVQDVSVALAAGDAETLSKLLVENAVWEIAGERTFEGRDAIIAASAQTRVRALTVDHAISHGRTGAANGRLDLENGRKIAFCDVQDFANAKGTSVLRVSTLRVPL
ncbi:nuclear transport factor 2 family protein [uncultured Nitratireductor sp.]|uniref:nuclear transport factor 2 family protein n=1 Tax=uncultured Nitratireductor sp. TaxID=520953 RepID=UPI0025EE53B5|nr:nuclear transport factor 2 family protein [uncultured Nitratireductor sp.]